MDFSTWAIWDTCAGFPGFSRSACASWVQAWGSIAAIGAAIWLGERQAAAARKLDLDRRNEADLLRTEIVSQWVGEAAYLAKELGAARERSRNPEHHRHLARAAEIERSFLELPPFELPGRKVAFLVVEAPKALSDLRHAAKACIDAWVKLAGMRPVDLPSRVRLEFDRAHSHAVGVFEAGQTTCRDQIAELRRALGRGQ